MLVDYYQACTNSYIYIKVYIYIDIINFRRFVTQKAAVMVLINLVPSMIAVKIVAIENPILKIVDIDWDDMYRKMVLLKQDIKDYQLNLDTNKFFFMLISKVR